MKNLLALLLLSLSFIACEEQLSAPLLLEKSIQYHDPNGNWASSDILLNFEQERPDTNVRDVIHVHINNNNGNFEVTKRIDSGMMVRGVQDGNCIQKINGEAPSEELAEKHRLTCERSFMYKDYYTYLYGLPMKLKDPGTIIDPEIQNLNFQGKEYHAIRVTYEEEVGDDIWYFYFDKETYAMTAYKFYHEEAKNDGEYITLEGEETVNGIRIPKTRAWYYNSDDKHLGTDYLMSGQNF